MSGEELVMCLWPLNADNPNWLHVVHVLFQTKCTYQSSSIRRQDDLLLSVFNYNTLERVHRFEAHADYIRSITVHPAQPYVLTCSGKCASKAGFAVARSLSSWSSTCPQMTCWSSCGTGTESGRAVRCFRGTFTTSWRSSSTPKIITSLPAHLWTEPLR